jgi:hypothetical protein
LSTGRRQRISNEARTPYAILTVVIRKRTISAFGAIAHFLVGGEQPAF